MTGSTPTSSRAGTSPAMVNEYHRILRAALKQGERWDLVPANVAERATPPTMPKRSITAPPPEDRVAELIDSGSACSDAGPGPRSSSSPRSPVYAAVKCAGFASPMSTGPVPAITVRRSVWQIGARSGVKLPKTHQIRRVPIGPRVLAALRLRWERSTANANATGVDLSAERLRVFARGRRRAPAVP